jgi:hypothetical protein
VNEREAPHHVPSLVALQGADQVPSDRQIRKRLLLLKRFLNPILTHIRQPRGHRGADSFRTMRLGDSHDAYGVLPTCGGLGSGHGITYGGQPSRQAWEVHNPLIYRKMVGY